MDSTNKSSHKFAEIRLRPKEPLTLLGGGEGGGVMDRGGCVGGQTVQFLQQ